MKIHRLNKEVYEVENFSFCFLTKNGSQIIVLAVAKFILVDCRTKIVSLKRMPYYGF